MGNEQKSRLVIFVSSVSRHFGLVARFAYAVKEIIKIKKKIFVMRALKKKKKNQYCFLLRGCQENPTLVKYSNGGS